VEEVIDRTGAWVFFDGASQGEPAVGGAGGILHLLDTHFFKFAAGLGRSTNNKAEIFVVFLVMRCAISRGILKLQVFGDSKLVVDWLAQRRALKNIHLFFQLISI